jgi:hypothetical protein
MRYMRTFADGDDGPYLEEVLARGEARRAPTSAGASGYPEPTPARAVKVGGAQICRFGPGELVRLKDTTGAGHIGRQVGDEEQLSTIVEPGQ